MSPGLNYVHVCVHVCVCMLYNRVFTSFLWVRGEVVPPTEWATVLEIETVRGIVGPTKHALGRVPLNSNYLPFGVNFQSRCSVTVSITIYLHPLLLMCNSIRGSFN